jgi:hypothetical protein
MKPWYTVLYIANLNIEHVEELLFQFKMAIWINFGIQDGNENYVQQTNFFTVVIYIISD